MEVQSRPFLTRLLNRYLQQYAGIPLQPEFVVTSAAVSFGILLGDGQVMSAAIFNHYITTRTSIVRYGYTRAPLSSPLEEMKRKSIQ